MNTETFLAKNHYITESASTSSMSSPTAFSNPVATRPTSASSFTLVTRTADDSDESGSDEEESQRGRKRKSKATGACSHCKGLKVKCVFDEGQKICRRCQNGKHICEVKGRKKRKPAPTHEDLQEKCRLQDQEIANLMQRIEQMKLDEKVRQWMEESTREATRLRNPIADRYLSMALSPAPYHELPEDERLVLTLRRLQYENDHSNAASQTPSLKPPDIIRYNAVRPEEISQLFRIFFDKINPFFSLLDPELHTPNRLIWSSPFLFTVICALASRFITHKPALYSLTMKFARDAAGKALVDGLVSIDVCQAYLLMAVYPRPGKKWDKDRSWLLMGVAIRIGLELKLDQLPPPDIDEREKANRIRTWMNCFCVDGAHATAYGKLPMSSLDDPVSRSCKEWYGPSPYNLPLDLQLVAYVDIIALMARFRKAIIPFDTKSAMDATKVDELCDICQDYDADLARTIEWWKDRYAQDHFAITDPLCAYRCNTTEMIGIYLRLSILSVAFPYAAKKGLDRDDYIATKSVEVATTVITIMVERLAPTKILRFAMEANFLYVAFAAAFLINLLRPQLLRLIGAETHKNIVTIVGRLIDVLGSKDVAMDERHTPALYHKFLSSLLQKYDQRPADAVPIRPGSTEFYPQYGPDRRPSPPNSYMWPDTGHAVPQTYADTERGDFANMVLPGSGDANMDFSLGHFVASVHEPYGHIPQQESAYIPQVDDPRLASQWFASEPSGYHAHDWPSGHGYPRYGG